MKTYFFTVRNLNDYRKHYPELKLARKIAKTMPDAAFEDFEQKFFLGIREELFGIPKNFSEFPIVGETSIPGLRLDFNFGLRLDVPEGNFHVRISDFDSGQIFFDRKVSDVRLVSLDMYFVRWQVEVFLDGKEVLSYVLNLEGKPVGVFFGRFVLGDTLAYLPVIREFQRIHRCKLFVYLPENFREFVALLYPDLHQMNEPNFKTFAAYYPLMTRATLPVFPADGRDLPMEHEARMTFGIKTLPTKPTFKPTAPPVTEDPYVCIGVQASVNRKGWLYPNGWDIVVSYLKSLGFRVFCIDRNAEQINDDLAIRRPADAEDFTGKFTIMERANMLYHAKFFIGLSSGLAWLADAVGCPVVMICGFSQDWYEFYTPYRVANRLVCNGCFNNVNVEFLHKLCPFHSGTPRELECQKKISPRQVLDAIEQLILDKNLI